MFPILSGQWKEIMLSGMPLHIPADECTCFITYNMIHRSISSDQDINSHLSNTQPYVSNSIRSMERNYVEWNVLHIPADECTCFITYNMIHRSIFSDQDINSHLSNTQPYFSDSIRSMERNYVEWNGPSHSSRRMHMFHNIQYDSQINFQ